MPTVKTPSQPGVKSRPGSSEVGPDDGEVGFQELPIFLPGNLVLEFPGQALQGRLVPRQPHPELTQVILRHEERCR